VGNMPIIALPNSHLRIRSCLRRQPWGQNLCCSLDDSSTQHHRRYFEAKSNSNNAMGRNLLDCLLCRYRYTQCRKTTVLRHSNQAQSVIERQTETLVATLRGLVFLLYTCKLVLLPSIYPPLISSLNLYLQSNLLPLNSPNHNLSRILRNNFIIMQHREFCHQLLASCHPC
jgi:hypothetical protein